MPTVELDYDELRAFLGREQSDDELKTDLFDLGLEYEGLTEDGDARYELEADRLDRLSVEGVARSLRYQYGTDRGVYLPDVNDPTWTIEVEDVPAERPYVTGAVVRGLDLDEAALESIIQLQEKLHATMGRKRRKGAIGVHDLTMLKGASAGVDGEQSIRYTGIAPDADRFVPLDADGELTPAEVLTEHPTGETYAPLVEGYERYPAIYDEIGLFSFPPVINGRRTEVTTGSRELFVEMTGTDQWTIDRMLNVVCYALDARGGQVEAVEVAYPDGTVRRPDLAVDEKTVTHDRVESTLGVDFDPEEVVDLLERSGLDAEPTETANGVAYEVGVPPYRVDVLHPADVVDDVGRAYGFNELDPRYPDVSTIGTRHERARLEEAVRTTLAGLGFEDLLNFHLLGRADNFDRMRISPETDGVGGGRAATITNPYSEAYEIVRTWASPSVLMVLENNTHRQYPQRLAEVGFAARLDERENTGVAERRTVAAAIAESGASYEDARATLQALARAFEVELETPPTEHPSFIDGRTAAVVLGDDRVGVVGEYHPEVIVEHDLEVPVVGFEFRLDALR
jgi:phenylalanyl-tRNA synthetase beta chain